MPRYALADSANDDIDEILSAIVAENEEAAWNWYAELHGIFQTLAHSPRIERVREDLLDGALMFPFGSYLIFHDIVPDGIRVIHIAHAKRNVGRLYGRPFDDPG